MTELIDIKDISGNIRLSTPINEGSKRKFLLMKEDYLTLRFSLDTPVYFKLGDGIDNEIGMFELVDLYKPVYNTNTGGYDYELKLDAYYWKWKNKKFFYNPGYGSREAGWNLTDTLKVHMNVFLKNLEVLGYKYHDKSFRCEIDDTVDTSSKLISYDNVNMIDALSQMAETFECEWWVEKDVIHFGRCEDGDPVDFELGMNVSKMDRSDSQGTYATRIYAFGSTRNIPPTYRKKLIFDVKQVNGRNISDTSRVLDINYFPSSAIHKEEYSLNIGTSGLVYTMDNREWRYDEAVAGTINGGTYKVSSDGISFSSSSFLLAGDLPVGEYLFKASYVYQLNGSQKEILIDSKSVSLTASDQRQISVLLNVPKELTIEKGASNLKIRTYAHVPGFSGFGETISSSVKYKMDLINGSSADTSVTFVTGGNKGKTFNAVYNPDLIIGGSNVLRLPEGITASLGDTYILNNIVTGKVPSGYFTDDKDSQTAEGIVTKHLMMPEGVSYIDAYPDMKPEEAVEQIVVFDDIYPRRVGITDSLTTHPYTDTIDNPDGTKTESKWIAWRFKDNDLGYHFSSGYKLDGEELRVTFQSGPLAGMDFEVIFNPYDAKGGDKYHPELSDDGTWNSDAQVFEIKRNDDYGRMLPDDTLHPTKEGGDKYILYGYDPQFVSDVMIPDAEKEVEERAREYIEKLKEDPSTYDSTLMPDYAFGINPETGGLDAKFAKSFLAGQRVNLLNKAYFEEGRISRIIGFEYNLDIPYDSPVYTVGETAPYSRIGEIESKIDSLTYKKEKNKQQTTSAGSSSSGGETISKLLKTISVTSPNVGYIKTGDVIPSGTSYEEIFINMLSQKASARLEGKISTSNDVEYGTQKGYLTYTAYRNGQGPMKQAYYDLVPSNVLNFSEEVSGVQTATRQLSGIYTQKETYMATVVYSASEDKSLPENSFEKTISVNVKRKWFAGVCNSIPQTSAEVRALGTSGFYTGPGTFKFPASNWKIVAVCAPSGTLSELSLTSYPANFAEDKEYCIGPIKISVEGANGSEAIDYNMWYLQTGGLNDPDTFTFKIV